MTKFSKIEAAALGLCRKERFNLVDKLLGTLPSPTKKCDSDAELAEILRRNIDLESGRVKALSEAEFWAGARRAQD